MHLTFSSPLEISNYVYPNSQDLKLFQFICPFMQINPTEKHTSNNSKLIYYNWNKKTHQHKLNRRNTIEIIKKYSRRSLDRNFHFGSHSQKTDGKGVNVDFFLNQRMNGRYNYD